MAKPKIVILGGGIAALSTALRLTDDQNWKEKFESITLHQMGWRLGGKCATGRGPHGRVEEHGIHLFGGGYYNALRMMRGVYRELHGAQGDARFGKHFQNQYTSVGVTGQSKTSSRFPESPLDLDNIENFNEAGDWMAAAIRALGGLVRDTPSFPQVVTEVRYGDGSLRELSGTVSSENPNIAPWLQDIDLLARQVEQGSPDVQSTLDRLGTVAGPERYDVSIAPSALDGAERLLEFPLQFRIAFDIERSLGMLNFIYALVSGWTKDILSGSKTFAALDDQDFADWLVSHGAWHSTIELDIVQAPIRLLYQYKDGDSTRAGSASMGAGGYLHWTLRTLAYMRSPFWFFREGTGDTVVAPIYQLLCKRGVDFEFFSKVEKLALDPAGKRIERIVLRKQATVRSGPTLYEPLDQDHWPSVPRCEQLVEGEDIAKLPEGELESYWSTFRATEQATLQADRDFDIVVFAISLGAVPFLCDDLMAVQPAWRQMVDMIKTTETQSLQIWMDRTSEELGVNEGMDPRIEPDDTGLGAGFAKPFDGFSDFSDLIKCEGWPASSRPKSLWYFSDVLADASAVPPAPDLDDPNYVSRRQADATRNAKQFLDSQLRKLLPASSGLAEFDYDRLVPTDPARATTPAERLAQQLIRANVQPSDRYVQALAGTTRYRLDAGRSAHFANLYLAGDWTFNGLNVGCFEAAAMSGLLAANDILGRAHDDGLIRYFGR